MPPELPSPSSWSPAFPPMAALGGAPIYSAGGEALLVSVQNAAAGVTITVTGRTLAFGESKPSPFSKSLIPATDRSVSTTIIPIPDGWLLSVQAIVSAGTPLTGQTFVKLSLIHGTASTGVELWTLAADYVTAKQAVSYPGAGIIDPTDSAGALRSITATVPGAGAEVSETVPTGARWNLIAFRATFTSNATVANRSPALSFDDGANLLFSAPNPFLIAASTTTNMSWGEGIYHPQNLNTVEGLAGVPANNRLAAGSRIRTRTLNIQAGDQYSVIQYLVREWIEGN